MLERFGHKVVILFKLLLLQKRVLFFHSPVRPLSTSILALLALFPGLVESGLTNCTSFANPPDSVVVESVPVPVKFIQPSETPSPEAEAGPGKLFWLNLVNYAVLKKYIFATEKQIESGKKVIGVDTTDDNNTSRESSFEDLRAPTIQEMESEVINFIWIIILKSDKNMYLFFSTEIRSYIADYCRWPTKWRLWTAFGAIRRCNFQLFTYIEMIY